jgi:hypothetical protein
LEKALTPAGISVNSEFPIMSKAPQADILILKRSQQTTWTVEQLKYLPDGIRDSLAEHILYKKNQNINDKQLQTFIISSKQPHKKTLENFTYVESNKKGVYFSENMPVNNIPLISLNRLVSTDYNSFIKLFASHHKERIKAIYKCNFKSLNYNLIKAIGNLLKYLPKLTEEQIMQVVDREEFEKTINLLVKEIIVRFIKTK